MNMKIAFKFVGVSAFALALVFSGCGKGKKSSSGSSSSRRSSKEDKSVTTNSGSKARSDFGFGSGSRIREKPVSVPMGRAKIQAEATKMAANGRKLHSAFICANVNRENAGKCTTVWPRTESEGPVETRDGGEQDIGDLTFTSATDYFNALFDMKHYGMTYWNPEVEDLDLGVLGKYACDGRTIRAAGLDWCIAANINDFMPDYIPVLISANFNPALLLREYDGKDYTPLPIGPESGAAKSMFNDEAIVVVRKGGDVEVIKKKYLTYDVLYKRTAFDLTNFNPPLKYLTPTGVVEPVGHR